MELRRLRVVAVLLMVVLAAACAKRPAMTQTAAPPPTAAVTAPPPRGPAGSRPPRASGAGTGRASGGRGSARPRATPAAGPGGVPERRGAPRRLLRLRQVRDQAGGRPRARRYRRLAEGQFLGAAPDRGPLRRARHQRLQPRARRAPREGRQEYLVARGIAAERITIISYGEERPVCSERTAACWGQDVARLPRQAAVTGATHTTRPTRRGAGPRRTSRSTTRRRGHRHASSRR